MRPASSSAKAVLTRPARVIGYQELDLANDAGGGEMALGGGLPGVEVLRVAEFLALCVEQQRRRGFTVEQTSSPALVLDVIKRVEKPYFTRILDPHHSDFTASNFFWLVVRRDGEPIGVVGSRVDVVSRSGFGDFISFQMARLYGEDGSGVLEDSVAPPPFAEMSGTLNYLGDLYIRPDFRGNTRRPAR